MARRFVFAVFALIVACKKPPPPPPPSPSPPLTSELGKQAAAFLWDARTLDADALMKAHGEEDRDLGFGARAWTKDLHDDTTFCAKGAIVFEGKTAIARVTCRPRDPKKLDWSSTKADLARVGADRHESEDAITIDFALPESLARLRATIARTLGPAPDVTVPSELRADYDDLELPLTTRYAFGASCGISGNPPEGARAIARISAVKRTDLVQALARSPSPEGRLYAVRALGDAALTAKLGAMRTPVVACFGCTYSRISTSDLVDADLSKCPSCEPTPRSGKLPWP